METTNDITMLIDPREKDLGGFTVRRVLPFRQQRQVGPFVFFDHMGPAEFVPGTGLNVRAHPHIGLATVTYIFTGEIFHKDSLGFSQAITPGAINYMIAGKGIVHAEKTREERLLTGQKLNALQLWMALPNEEEECEPAFLHYPATAIPELKTSAYKARVLLGEAFGKRSPVDIKSPTLYVEIHLKSDQTMVLPFAKERAAYVVDGALEVTGHIVEAQQMAVLSPNREICVKAKDDCHFVIVGGDPVGERHLYWNFVSSRPERIEQAKQDWQSGKFSAVPGETELIPLPE